MPFTLFHAHAMSMILSYIIFGSTGILFSRYGRSIRLGNRRQLLGKAVWFQLHRFLLSFTSFLTLLGFLFILVFAGGQWLTLERAGIRSFVHSILGGIIVCCTIIQVWLALYRCNPHSRFRYIFAWSHRITGFLAFGLVIPNMFLMIVQRPRYRTILIILISLWTGWIVILILIFERIEYKLRATVAPVVVNVRGDDANTTRSNTNAPGDIESGLNTNVGSRQHNLMKLALLLLHVLVSIPLTIALIVFICS